MFGHLTMLSGNFCTRGMQSLFFDALHAPRSEHDTTDDQRARSEA